MESATPTTLRSRNNTNQINPYWLKKHAKSGDLIGVSLFDGFDSIIHWVTGGPITHVAMLMWKGVTLYVVEARGAGLIRTPIENWLPSNRGNAVWMKLS